MRTSNLLLLAGFFWAGVGCVSPLVQAINEGRSADALKIVEAGEGLNEPSGDQNYTPLMHAIEKGDMAVFQALLKRGANPKTPSAPYNVRGFGLTVQVNYTPLIVALQDGEKYALMKNRREQLKRYEMAKMLLEAGADVKYVTVYGIEALTSCNHPDCFEIAEVLISRGARIDGPVRYAGLSESDHPPIGGAVIYGNVRLVRLLIEKGAVLDIRKPFYNPLRAAISRYKEMVKNPAYADKDDILEMVKLLVEAGANPHFKPDDGVTPAAEAKNLGFTDISDILTKAEPKKNEQGDRTR